MTREEVIAVLQDALKAELAAVEMYAAHAKAIPEAAVSDGVRAILEVEQEHAANLSRRIRELGGRPVEPGGPSTVAGRVATAASQALRTADMLRLELSEEQTAIKHYAMAVAEIMDDEDTLSMLTEHLQDEIAHATWMKRQIRILGAAR
ncbi:MAG: ferritin-like domain-containing protein [Anaerolineae bacterium]|jgi:bacterioferritin (cytochrome b1)|nr:ferritin-like domain-containing protein [Anaerolineae bacterium]